MKWFEGLATRASVAFIIVVLLILATTPLGAHALAGARSYVSNETGDVFLGGDYIELGISKFGSFGTTEGDDEEEPIARPPGFFGTASRNNIGMSTNPTGFGVAPDLRMDFFMPGSPEERWVIGYKEDGNPTTASNAFLSGSEDIADNTITNQSSGSKLQATSEGTFDNKLKTTQVISFNQSEKFFKNEVTVRNVSGSTLDSVRYMRSFDPDNTVDQDGEYETRNSIPFTQQAGDGKAVVIADTSLSDSDPVFMANGSRSPILFYSSDSRARVSTFGFGNEDPYEAEAYDDALPKGTSVDEDQAITIAFDVGSLAPGASQTVVYYTSLDNRDFSEVLQDIAADDEQSSGGHVEGPNNGDGNGDGVADSTQPNVQYVKNSVAGEGKYVTLETTGCGTVSSLDLKDVKQYGTDGLYSYPLGLVNFDIACTNPGDTTTIKLYYDQLYNTTNWAARKYIDGKFITIPAATFGTATVGSQTVTTLTYQVTDGGALDADKVVNGAIVDPAGPAILTAATAPNTGLVRESIYPALAALLIGIGYIVYNVRKLIARSSS